MPVSPLVVCLLTHPQYLHLNNSGGKTTLVQAQRVQGRVLQKRREDLISHPALSHGMCACNDFTSGLFLYLWKEGEKGKKKEEEDIKRKGEKNRKGEKEKKRKRLD